MNQSSVVASSLNHTQFLICVFLACLGGFLFLALLSFSAFDPSWSYLSSDTQHISNLTGVAGAWIGNLLRAFFGWASLLIPFFLWLEIYHIYHHHKNRLKRYFAQITLIFVVAILSALLLNNAPMTHSGGIIGYAIAHDLSKITTIYGALFIMLFMLIMTFSASFNIKWVSLTEKLQNFPLWLKDVCYIGQDDAILLKQYHTLPKTHQQQMVQQETTNPLTQPTTEQNSSDTAETSAQSTATTENQNNSTINITAGQVVFGDVWQNNDKSNELLNEMQQLLEQSQQQLSAHHEFEQQVLQRKYEEETRARENISNVIKSSVSNESFDALQSQFIQQEHATQQDIAYLDKKINDLNQQIAQLQAEPTPPTFDEVVMHESYDFDNAPVATTDVNIIYDENHLSQESTLEPTQVQTAPVETNTTSIEIDETHHTTSVEAKTISTQNPSLNRIRERLTQPNPLADLQSLLNHHIKKVPKTPVAVELEEFELPKKTSHSFDESSFTITHDTPLEFNDLTHQPVQNRTLDFALDDDFIHHSTPAQSHIEHESVQNNAPQHYNPFKQTLHDDTHDNTKVAYFDDDAPLTDASGRIISRAMQVAEYRKTLSPLPSISLLDPVDHSQKVRFSDEELDKLAQLLELKLQDFNIKASVEEIDPGPVVTRFALSLAPGVKATKVASISQDLARSMSLKSVRIVLSIPGTPFIGVEIPNKKREMVRLIELIDNDEFRNPEAGLSVAMGKNITGKPIITNLAKAPHMLVAGTTGSGKSVAVNAILLSLLLKYTPEQLRLVLIDPKMLELANYDEIPHLLTPVITDMNKATNALNWCVNEMERRYELMAMFKLRQIAPFNERIRQAQANGEDLIDPLWKPSDSATQQRAPRLEPLPSIVVIADEFADMMMQQSGKKTETLITRLAQKARAAGIHLLLATQRPSVDVITGLIKANVPTRVALRVNSKIDSRTILDAGGAEELLGNGDMLFLGPGQNEPERVHGAFISDDEVNRICDAWRERGSPNYVDDILVGDDEEDDNSSRSYDDSGEMQQDVLYDRAVEFVLRTRKASGSALQREFGVGYQRGAKLIDMMERNGIVSPANSSNKREILV
ncbi:DNA translocase FtsK [Moraxella sp. ZY210820]|uniref:DNA translocase FtsK n=1 Tax=unclassified Moraxella TaxID=2685852 RepID=UPI00273046EE|nr:DNA translocase FtsK [Moraxella sp. ZY210820]WLF84432.1 DNA translocase FtsK 4TM domain-containing protein [Moraxella sp. ZY210820]